MNNARLSFHRNFLPPYACRPVRGLIYAEKLLRDSAAAWLRGSSLFLFFTRSLFSTQPLRPALMIALVRFGLTGFLFVLFVACAGGGGGGGGGGGSSSPKPTFPLMDVSVNGMNVTEGDPVILEGGTPAIFSANITSCINLCGPVRIGYFRSDDTNFSPEEEIGGMNLTLNASDSGKLIEFDFTAEEAPGSYHYGVCINGDACVAAVEIIVPGLEITDISVDLRQGEDSLDITTEVFCYGDMPCARSLIFYLSADANVSNEDRELRDQIVTADAGMINSTDHLVRDLQAVIGPGDYYIGACAGDMCTAGENLVVAGLNFVDFDVSLPSLNLTSLPLVKPEDSLNIAAEVRCYGEAACDNTMVYFFRMLGEEGEQELLNTPASVLVAGNTARNFTFMREVVNYTEDFALYDVCTDLDRGVCTDQVNVSLDSDSDGIANGDDTDDDGDGLLDTADTGDSASMIPCRLLADCDSDGLNDNEDAGVNSVNMLCRHLIDCDSDGLNDIEDTGVNNSTLVACRVLADCDDDGLNDNVDTGESTIGSLCRLFSDCDRDGLDDIDDTGGNSDGILCHILTDCDGDGLLDGEDTGVNNRSGLPCHLLIDCDDDGILDIDDTGEVGDGMFCHIFPDCDGDGILDIDDTGESVGGSICRLQSDCDNDGLNDNVDVDVTGDGLIELRTADELNNIRYVLDGSGYQESETATKDTTGCPATGCTGYELVAAADLSSYGSSYDGGKGWQPIGETATPFTAIFDGNGFPIRNLFIERADEDDIGFFGVISGDALIRSVSLEDIMVTGRSDVGGLIGETAAGGRILASAVSGDVVSSLAAAEGPANAGGLVGNGKNTTIIASYARGMVSGMGSTVGGLVGNGKNTTIITSYTTNSTVSGDSMVGGLVGDAGTDGITITASYAVGTVDMTGTGASSAGGLIGSGGNLMITNSYWDSSVNGITTSGSGEPKTTAELQLPLAATGIYADWMQTCPNDESVFAWDFGNTNHYPALNCPSGGILLQRY